MRALPRPVRRRGNLTPHNQPQRRCPTRQRGPPVIASHPPTRRGRRGNLTPHTSLSVGVSHRGSEALRSLRAIPRPVVGAWAISPLTSAAVVARHRGSEALLSLRAIPRPVVGAWAISPLTSAAVVARHRGSEALLSLRAIPRPVGGSVAIIDPPKRHRPLRPRPTSCYPSLGGQALNATDLLRSTRTSRGARLVGAVKVVLARIPYYRRSRPSNA